jgi:16S rRNA (cytosine1402-N4)-methyltransferase
VEHQAVFHVPVLPVEVFLALGLRPGGVFFDGTCGGGGHTRWILERLGGQVRVVAVDRDPEALARAAHDLAEYPQTTLTLRRGSYADVGEHLEAAGLVGADAMLLDLGVSLHQLVTGERGFSHDRPGAVDMRFNPEEGLSAAQWVAQASRDRLIGVLRDFGDVRDAARAADVIRHAILRDKVGDTQELARTINSNVRGQGRKVAVSTLCFQALRIAVNGEFDELERFLAGFPASLNQGGVLAVISYHSGEDRRVKRAFQALVRTKEFELVHKKSVVPTAAEVRRNRRSRSARLRAIRKVTCS